MLNQLLHTLIAEALAGFFPMLQQIRITRRPPQGIVGSLGASLSEGIEIPPPLLFLVINIASHTFT